MFFFEENDDGYDMIEDDALNGETGNVYGALDEDLELQTIDNPYYDGEGGMVFENNSVQGRNVNPGDQEIITRTSNIYYGL